MSNGRRCIGKRRKGGSGLAFNPQPTDYFFLKKNEFPGPTPLKTLFWTPVCVGSFFGLGPGWGNEGAALQYQAGRGGG